MWKAGAEQIPKLTGRVDAQPREGRPHSDGCAANIGHEEALPPRRDETVRLARAVPTPPTGHQRTPPTPDPMTARARPRQGSSDRRKTPATPGQERQAPGLATDTTPGPGPPAATGRCGLSGWCGLEEANPVGSRVDKLHLPAVRGAWANARIEERVSALVEFGV